MEDITLEGLNKAGYKYYAFISYNHKDEKWAKGLQSKLRRYRLPSVARTEIGADVRIDPVFRYKTNLPVAQLREQIKEELDRSKYLIVVCSRHSAKPNIRGEHWVNDEVQRFIRLGRIDRIVPVIVDGVPNSGDGRECFCPALRENEISAVNLRDGWSWSLDRKHEFLRLVAKLLNLDPAELIREADEEARWARIRRFLCWLPGVLLGVVGAIFSWDALRPVTRYYRDYVDCYGLPEGIFEVSKEDARMRWRTYRFDYQGLYWNGVHTNSLPKSISGVRRRLVKVSMVNPLGVPVKEQLIVNAGRPTIQEFEYDGHGRLCKIIVRNRGGSDLTSGPCLKKICYENRGSTVNGRMWATDADDMKLFCSKSISTQQKSSDTAMSYAHITDYFIDRNRQGRMIVQSFRTGPNHDRISSDENGVCGFRYDLRTNGQVEKITYLSSDLEERTQDGYGVSVEQYKYDDAGNVVQIQYQTAESAPVLGRRGFVKNIMSFDAFGNITNEVLNDARDKRMWRHIPGEDEGSEMGGTTKWCECSYVYSNGFLVARYAYRPDGALMTDDGEAAKITWTYSANGDETSRSFFDENGDLKSGMDGYARVVLESDKYTGTLLRFRFFDKDLNKCSNREGIWGADRMCDGRGNILLEKRLDVDGNITESDKCNAIVKWDYDGSNRPIAESCYDEHTNLSVNVVRGGDVSICKYWYDDWGNVEWCRYYSDSMCKVRATDKDGYSGWHHVYDVSGRIVENWNVGQDEIIGRVGSGRKDGSTSSYVDYVSDFELLPGIRVLAGWRSKLVTWYKAPNVVDMEDGWCAKLFVFDDKGRCVLEAYKNEHGQFVTNVDGYAACVMTWDAYGRDVAEYYYDVKGDPARNVSNNAFGRMSAYDADSGKETNRWYVGADQSTHVCFKDEAYSDIHYELEGVQECTSYWRDDHAVLCGDGYHREVVKKNTYGERVDEWYFDTRGIATNRHYSNGFRVHHAHAEYDSCRNMTLAERIEADGTPSVQQGMNYSAIHNEFDQLNRIVAKTYYCDWKRKTIGADGNGVAKTQYYYDGRSRKVQKVEDFGSGSKPCLYGYAGVTRRVSLYDVRGNVTNQCFYGTNDMPVVGNNNAHRTCRRFEAIAGKSLQVAEWYLDENDHETADKNGVARIETAYDANCEKTRDDLYAPKGLGGIWDYEKVHHVIRLYDADGNEIEQSFWNVDGKPTVGNDGISRRVCSVEGGKVVDVKYYGLDDRELNFVSVAYAAEILVESQAAAQGVEAGDVFCRFGGYDIVNPSGFSPIPNAIAHVKESGMTILFARKRGNGYVLIEKSFPPGIMGIRIADKVIPEVEYKKILSVVSQCGR